MSDQLSLFAEASASPKGIRYQPDFVTTRDHEQVLIDRLRDLPLTPFQFGAFEGKRRVASFGWRYDCSRQALEPADDIPDWLAPLASQIEQFAKMPADAVGQVLCTEYEAGVGIGWHRDKPHFDRIFGLSLASRCKFRFRRKAGTAWRGFTLEAEPRSLYMMSDESRHGWEHSIPPVEATRYSITFRTMAEGGRRASPGPIR
ncbi:MAG: alpha-ketoglutarate-dependent dioxygenase AlkB [Pseudorhodoplanes sp.]|uniref:alpha-ketoglutarate-dependent dioxygenase AlkB n=1 Tax=Pseudorhodoplanes sp. TaxID=1934341 RepID=UPI003D0CC046